MSCSPPTQCPECGSLVVVRYLDHVLFRNCSSETVKPTEREAIGWITKQNDAAIWLVWDRNVEGSLQEKSSGESGLVILRSEILELKKVC